jgi:hypothetical protein
MSTRNDYHGNPARRKPSRMRKMTITHKQALRVLMGVSQERITGGHTGPHNEDYFYGRCDRWSMVIREMSANPEKGRILDIGAHEGFFCGALVKLNSCRVMRV